MPDTWALGINHKTSLGDGAETLTPDICCAIDNGYFKRTIKDMCVHL